MHDSQWFPIGGQFELTVHFVQDNNNEFHSKITLTVASVTHFVYVQWFYSHFYNEVADWSNWTTSAKMTDSQEDSTTSSSEYATASEDEDAVVAAAAPGDASTGRYERVARVAQ